MILKIMATCITKEPGICGEVSSCYLALNRNAGSALKLPKTIDNLKNYPTIGDRNCE